MSGVGVRICTRWRRLVRRRTFDSEFACDHIGSTCGDLARVINEVTTDGNTNAVGVHFLGFDINNDAGIGHSPILGYVFDFGVVHIMDGFGANGETIEALAEPCEFFGHCFLPNLFGGGVPSELFVGERFARGRIEDSAGENVVSCLE